MLGYILRRVLILIPMLLFISVIVFQMLRMVPGDPVMLYLGSPTERISQEFIDHTRHELGLDQPVPVQYVRWLGRTLTGDLGRSAQTRQAVNESIMRAFPKTAYLSVVALVIALLLGIPAGIMSALYRNSKLDMV